MLLTSINVLTTSIRITRSKKLIFFFLNQQIRKTPHLCILKVINFSNLIRNISFFCFVLISSSFLMIILIPAYVWSVLIIQWFQAKAKNILNFFFLYVNFYFRQIYCWIICIVAISCDVCAHIRNLKIISIKNMFPTTTEHLCKFLTFKLELKIERNSVFLKLNTKIFNRSYSLILINKYLQRWLNKEIDIRCQKNKIYIVIYILVFCSYI